jgi:PAS domain S-box-containing protein
LLAEHPSPHQLGERVWGSSEPWIAAVANLADDPAVLLAELPDWAALLDRHSTVHLERAGADTRVLWNNVPGLALDARECLVRLGALSGLFSYAAARSPFDIRHTQCRAHGDEDCLYVIENLAPRSDPTHADVFREAFLMATKLRGQEVFLRRLRKFSARYGPFPDVREARAVRRFIEEVEDIIFILDRSLWVLDANRAATRFSGIDLNELRGLSARDLMTAESFELVHRNLPELFEQGVLSGLQIMGRTRRGVVPLEVSARLAHNGESMVCIAHDVSRHLQLERELEARNQLLQEQNKRISEAAVLKSEFLANVSHELTTPLTCIRGFAKLLRGEIEADLEGAEPQLPMERRVEFLAIVQDEAQRMGELIGGLLELSKIESGVVTLDRSRVSLNKIVQESLLVLKPRLDELSIRVDCRLDPTLPMAFLDPDLMKQVVLNLLDNAIKFSPDGSEISVRTHSGEGVMQLRVRNPSSELKAGDLNRIFERFVQRDGSFSRQHGGVGLGLDLVRAIVERHGGQVWGELPAPGQVEFIAEIRLPKS